MRPHHGHLADDRIGTALGQLTLPLVAGMVFGGALLVYLRHHRLRWTWGFFLVPLAYGSWLVSWRAGLVLAVGAATAIGGGARWHMEAIGRGGEEARAAGEAIGPLVVLRSLFAERGARRHRRKGRTLAIGRTRRGSVCRVPIGAPRHGVHSLILGATGEGKTVTMAALVQAHIVAGQGAIVLDPKGDAALRRTIADATAAAGTSFTAWSPEGPAIYNPLRRGNPTEIADKCIAAHNWTEPHYRTATQRLLGHALATMRAAGNWPPTLSGLVAHMEPERLDSLVSRVGGQLAERVHAYVDGLDSRRASDLGGGRDRLAVLVESELGPWLDPTLGEGAEEIDLTACLDRGEVAYFGFDADRYPEASKLLAAALAIDLAVLAAERQGSPVAGAVLIDEFGALAADHVSRLFARSRGAGISLLLATQSLADLRAADSGDADVLSEQVFANVAYSVCHRIADPDSAERLARLGGTEPAWSVTERIDRGLLAAPRREGTRTRQRDFIVGPDTLKWLDTGQAVVINPKAPRKAEVVSIWPPRQLAPATAATIRKGGLR